MTKNFIQKAIKKKGSLRKALKVKKGETIPAKKLKAAAKKKGKIGQRARFAETLKKLRTKKANDGKFMDKGVGKADEKYRKIVKDRLQLREKKVKENYFPKDIREGKYDKKDKDTLTFIKKVRARDKTGKKSAIDTMANRVKKKEQSSYNVERGMGKGYKLRRGDN